jgi:ketosteroid isomerase-like protein
MASSLPAPAILASVPRSRREIVERAYVALNAGDPEGFMAIVRSDAEWHWPPGVADTDVYRGIDEIRRAVGVWTDAWIDFRMEPEEMLEQGDSVFVAVRYSGRGRTSGLPIDQAVAHVWELSGDQAVLVRMFGDVEKARRRFLER